MQHSTSAIVPNVHPKIPPSTRRLAVIGEAPSEDDLTAGEPFVGTAGRFLRAVIASSGGVCNQTFFGNICQHRPKDSDITNFNFHGPEITEGFERLQIDLARFRPNTILLLGKVALRAFNPTICPTGKGNVVTVPLSDWRGSVFLHNGVKTLGTYDPAYVLRSYNDYPFFKFDVARAVRQAEDPALKTFIRQGVLRPTLHDVITFLTEAQRLRTPLTLDIEGYPDTTGVTMLSLVPTHDPSTGIVIPFHLAGGPYWTEEEETQVWSSLSRILADPDIPKTAHNCFYELFVLAWRHRCVVNSLIDDTMMAHWELYPDFAKGDKEERQKVSATQKKRSLGVCASLYTLQPFYKDDRLSNDETTRLNYNFLDSSVTAEIRNVTTELLRKQPLSYTHYRFNISLIPAYNYTMLRGVRFDRESALELTRKTETELHEINETINRELEVRKVFHLFPVSKADEKHRARDGFNVKSSKQKCWLIYDLLKCKPLKRWGITSDEDALLHFFSKTQDPILRNVIRAVRLRTRISDIGKLVCDADGRIRTSYDLVGTNSGRLSSRNSMSLLFDPTEGWINTGTNVQNQTKDLRVCYTADSIQHLLCQADLEGADAWTVGAELAALGHSAMLNDLLYGIKPSLVLYHMIEEHAAGRNALLVNTYDKEKLRTITRDIRARLHSLEGTKDSTGRPADWLYLCCKRVQHGSNYDMHAARTAELVFGDSDGAVAITEREAAHYQQLYKLRYKTDIRNEWIRKQLCDTGCITTSCGVRRQFFALRNRYDIDDAIVREASAVNPQCNTTYITNRALLNLWNDPDNRLPTGSLRVEPLIQVHDALVTQFHSSHHLFAADAMKRWFQVPIRVSGIEVNIPVDARTGDDWKNCKTPLFT